MISRFSNLHAVGVLSPRKGKVKSQVKSSSQTGVGPWMTPPRASEKKTGAGHKSISLLGVQGVSSWLVLTTGRGQRRASKHPRKPEPCVLVVIQAVIFATLIAWYNPRIPGLPLVR